MNNNYKSLITIMVAIFYLALITAPPVEASSKWSFMAKIVKKNKKKLATMAKDIKLSSLKKALPNAAMLSRRIDIPAKMLRSPAVRKMALAGEKIMSHGRFATKMLNKSEMPASVISQYSRFGKGKYLTVAKTIGETMTKSKTNISSALSKLKGKYKGMNNVINKWNTGKYNDDIFVRTIKNTGKGGMKVLKWVADHPRMAMAGAAGAWYLSDPEGFEDTLAKSGQTIGAFVGETMVSAAAGVGEGVTSGLSKSFSMHSISSMILGGLAIGFAFLLALSRTFRRLLLLPFAMLGKKANAKMDEMEQQPVRTSSHTRTEPKTPNTSDPARKRKSNL